MGRQRRTIRRTRWRLGGQRGYALVVVMVFITLSTMLVSVAYDRMHQLFRFEESSDRLSSTSDGIEEALGVGLARLQTGEPTVDGFDEYTCDLKLRQSDGSLTEYRLTYTKLPDNRWRLQAEPASTAMPACPAVFIDNPCPVSS